MSGTLYAMAADSLVRAYLAQVTLTSARLALFADGVAVAMRDITEALQPLLLFGLLERWFRAAGQALKMSKCDIIMLGDDARPYESFMETLAPSACAPCALSRG